MLNAIGDSRSTTIHRVVMNALHVPISRLPTETTYRKAVNSVRSQTEKSAWLLVSCYLGSSILHLQCFEQKCSHIFIQRYYRTPEGRLFLAGQRRATKVNEVRT